MNAVTPTLAGELVDDISAFFAPVSSDLIDMLVGEFEGTRARITALAEAVRSEQCSGVLHYFVEGNTPEQRHGLPSTVEALFNVEGAVGQLTANFWNRALRMTDVIDYMPQKRRDEWFEQIRHPLGRKKNRHSEEYEIQPLPEFNEDNVRATLGGLMASRAQFFAERVDGIFRALSRSHVTNTPQGFNKRMILQYAITSYGTVNHSTAGVINDLRCVIAKFMGRDEPKYGATDAVIKTARQDNGKWTGVDGNAFRIRIYNGVGTAHIEVHPEMAWRLNAVLASMYPQAIPSKFREKPKRQRKIKDFELFDRPLPFAVIDQLANMSTGFDIVENRIGANGRKYLPNTRRFAYGEHDKHARAEAENVLRAIGGVWDAEAKHWAFDYDPEDVMAEVVCSGCIPDHKSHQFYPTPASIAEAAVGLADIGPEHTCLEPSAGQGALADLMPLERTTCVEFSGLHHKILSAKGHNAVWSDFLPWAAGRHKEGKQFDRVVMNPPFSQGRWQAHLEAAAKLVCANGVLVAILPASAKGKQVLEGFDLDWSSTYSNEFAGTSVSVVILKATRK